MFTCTEIFHEPDSDDQDDDFSIFWWPSLKWAHELTNAINEFKRGAFWSQSPHWGGLQTCVHLNHTMKTYWSSCIILWRVWRSNCMMKHHLADEEQTRTVIEYYLFQERSMFRSCERHDWVCGCEVARQPLNAQLRRRTSVFYQDAELFLKTFFLLFSCQWSHLWIVFDMTSDTRWSCDVLQALLPRVVPVWQMVINKSGVQSPDRTPPDGLI